LPDCLMLIPNGFRIFKEPLMPIKKNIFLKLASLKKLSFLASWF
jgi:hypothetical protein